MDQVSLDIPVEILDSLPEDGEATALDMERAVTEWERTITEELSSEQELAGIVDLLERFERRWEMYDEFVVELRAWGQSPIYAIAWRNLHAAMIRQLYDHEELADRIDRERHARIVDDGIRRSD